MLEKPNGLGFSHCVEGELTPRHTNAINSSSSSVSSNWAAPSSLAAITSGQSSWHVQEAFYTKGGTGRFIAGHFRLTGEGDALHGWPHGARTQGRALRRLRRHLAANPVAFA